MYRKILIIVTAVATLLSFVPSLAYAEDTVDSYIHTSIEQANIPGLELTMIRDGTAEKTRTYGNLKSNSIMPVGSISKPLTAYAISQLVAQNKLTLSSSVSSYLSGSYFTYQGKRVEVTISQLLNHSSGLSTADGRVLLGYNDDSVSEHAKRVYQAKLVHAPGLQYEYSNANYALLGAVIEKVSQESYATFMQKNVFEPLEMNDTSAYASIAQSPRYAQGYQSWFGYNVALKSTFNVAAAPYGYIASTVQDLASFVTHFIDQPDLKKKLHRHAIDIDSGEGISYALGWVVERSGSTTTILHAGDNAQYAAFFQIGIDSGDGAVVMVNRNHHLEPMYALDIGLGLVDISNGIEAAEVSAPGGGYRLSGALVSMAMLGVGIVYTLKLGSVRRRFRRFMIAMILFIAISLPIAALKLSGATFLVAFMYAQDVSVAVVIFEFILFCVGAWLVAMELSHKFKFLS